MTLTHIDQSHVKGQFSLPSRLGAQCIAVAIEVRDRTKLKIALCNLSGRQLRDIGLTRNDVDVACSGSLLENAARELRDVALVRAGNW